MGTPQTARVMGQTATLFRDGAPPVYLLPDGRFAVERAGKWVARKTLQAVESLNRKGLPELVVMRPSPDVTDYGDEARPMVEYKDGKARFKGQSTASRSYTSFFVYDPEIAKSLNALAHRRARAEEAFLKEYEGLVARLVRVTEDDFEELAQKHGKKGGES